MAKNTFFEILNSLNMSKKDIWQDSEEVEKTYSPFVINMMMARSISSIQYANEVNRFQEITKEQHYQYMLHGVPKEKRFNKGFKLDKVDVDVLKYIKEWYEYSDKKATEALELLSEEEIQYIIDMMNTGGTE